MATESLVEDVQGGYIIQGEKMQKKQMVYIDFGDFEKVYDKVNRGVLWQVLECLM